MFWFVTRAAGGTILNNVWPTRFCAMTALTSRATRPAPRPPQCLPAMPLQRFHSCLEATSADYRSPSVDISTASLTTESLSGLSRSQEMTRTELVKTTSIRAAIFSSTKALPRTPLRVSAQNWCHFTVPPRPRTLPPIQSGALSGYVVASLSVGVG